MPTRVPPGEDHIAPTAPPEGWMPLVRMVRIAARPLERFLKIEASSGIFLLLATATALLWANSPWAHAYTTLLHAPLGVRIGAFAFERDVEWLVNDGLMAVFFFVVGLEIRRELHHGELSDWRRASVPAAAAFGGMLVPALIYLAVAGRRATISGWGIPTATDIAFAVGVLALLGKRVPPPLRVLLLALAVIDDLGAVVVIAVFYSSLGSASGLGLAALGLLVIIGLQRSGVRAKVAYLAPGAVVWAGIGRAGVHPAIAGVLVGLVTPVRAWLGPAGFAAGVQAELKHLKHAAPTVAASHVLATRLRRVHLAMREAVSPADSLIGRLHPWVAYGIMPLFALVNAGVELKFGSFDVESRRAMAGVVMGLVIGKPVGVLLGTALALRSGVGVLPQGITLRHLVVLGLVAGIGFTMALFVAALAFSDPRLLDAAKLAVLLGSVIAGVLGLLAGRAMLKPDAVVPPH